MVIKPKLKKVSWVIPVYNEEEILEEKLGEIVSPKWAFGYRREIIVVNDGSTDNSTFIIKKFSGKHKEIRLIDMPENSGKGAAVKNGIGAATGELVIFSDLDLSVPLGTAREFIKAFKNGYDVIITSRRKQGAEIVRRQPWLRETLGRGFTWMTRTLLGLSVSDFTCGFKAFDTKVAKRIFEKVRVERWAFDAEVLFVAARMGNEIKEIPAKWRNREDSRVNLRRDLYQSLVDVFLIRVNDLRGLYGRREIVLPLSYLWLMRSLTGRPRTVLDLGCGDGKLMEAFGQNGWEVTGVDICSESIAEADRTGMYKQLIEGDVVESCNGLLEQGRKYDLVFCSQLIEHLTRRQGKQLMRLAERLSRKTVFFSTPRGFMRQPEVFIQGNPSQVHKSGWTAEEFASRGYRVYGVGFNPVWSENGLARRENRYLVFVGSMISYLMSPVCLYFPSVAAGIMAVKERGG